MTAAKERGQNPRRDQFRTIYWLLENGERVGTLGLESVRFGRDEIGVSSLYVRPDCRGGEIARRTLDAAYDAATQAGMFGVRIDTYWSWQPAVRFYLHLAFWVWTWKHQLGLVRSAWLPPYRVVMDGSRAAFSTAAGDVWTPLIQGRAPWHFSRLDGDRGVLGVCPVVADPMFPAWTMTALRILSSRDFVAMASAHRLRRTEW